MRHGEITKRLFFILALICALGWSCAAQANLFKDTLNFFFDQSRAGGMCWYCPAFEAVLRVMNSLASNVAKELAEPIIPLMAAGLLVVLAFKVGRMLATAAVMDAPTFIDDLTKTMGRALVATVFLMNFMQIFYWILTPVFDAALTLSQSILDSVISGDKGMAITKAAQNAGTVTTKCAYDALLREEDFRADSAFPLANAKTLICWVEMVSNSMGVGMALGLTFMKLAFVHKILAIFPNIALLISGAVIMGVFFVAFLSFPFKLIDGLVKLAFIIALTPVWVVLWVFPITASYTKRAWDGFISVCFLFVSLSVLIAVMLIMFDQIIPAGTRDDIFQKLIQDKPFEAVKLIDFKGRDLFVVLAIGFIGKAILNLAEPLANSFTGVKSYTKIGPSMEATAMKATKAVAMPVLKTAAPLAGKAALKTTAAVATAVFHPRRTLGSIASAVRDPKKLAQRAGAAVKKAVQKRWNKAQTAVVNTATGIANKAIAFKNKTVAIGSAVLHPLRTAGRAARAVRNSVVNRALGIKRRAVAVKNGALAVGSAIFHPVRTARRAAAAVARGTVRRIRNTRDNILNRGRQIKYVAQTAGRKAANGARAVGRGVRAVGRGAARVWRAIKSRF